MLCRSRQCRSLSLQATAWFQSTQVVLGRELVFCGVVCVYICEHSLGTKHRPHRLHLASTLLLRLCRSHPWPRRASWQVRPVHLYKVHAVLVEWVLYYMYVNRGCTALRRLPCTIITAAVCWCVGLHSPRAAWSQLDCGASTCAWDRWPEISDLATLSLCSHHSTSSVGSMLQPLQRGCLSVLLGLLD